MKRLKITAILLIACMAVSLLSSCFSKKVETVEDFFAAIDEAMEELDSYELKSKLDMTLALPEDTLSAKADSKIVVINNEEDPYYFNEANTSVSAPRYSINQTIKQSIVYDGGTMFSTTENGDDSSKVSSKTSKESFEEYLDDGAEIDELLLQCETKDFTMDKDGGEINCSGYSV